MSSISSVAVVDDGQLDRVYEILEELGAEPERIRASQARHGVEKPHDLIVVAWHPTKEIPELLDNADGVEPTKVCFHSQDFLPLRQRLRDLGVDYLVQSALDNDSLRAFLQSQLHRGAERRADLRLQLGGMVLLQIGEAKERVKLADLSTGFCRVVGDRAISLDQAVTIVLPKGLGGDATLEISGRVIRSRAEEQHKTRMTYSIVVRFEGHADAVRAQLAKILAGEQIGTRATPLQPRTTSVAPADTGTTPVAPADTGTTPVAPADTGTTPVAPGPPERRSSERHPYDRKVSLLDLGGAAPALGCDLSLTGVRLTGAPAMEEGTKVTIALYGAAKRGEPVVVEASVARVDGAEVGLQFAALNEAQRRDLERLLGATAMVESLRGDAGSGRRVISRVLPRNAA